MIGRITIILLCSPILLLLMLQYMYTLHVQVQCMQYMYNITIPLYSPPLLLMLLHMYIIYYYMYNTVDLENFGVKKFCIAHTSTKLKHTRFFYYKNFTFE